MFQRYISILLLGCSISTTISLKIIPKAVEWLNPNYQEINTNSAARIYVNGSILTLTNRQKSDEGKYTCRLMSNHSIKAAVILQINIVGSFFVYSSSSRINEEKSALRYQDKFINCSIKPIGASTKWKHNNITLYPCGNPNYSKNTSGLIIYNVTKQSQGLYTCIVGNWNPLKATILLRVDWPPVLLFEQNQTVLVNVSEQVVLNCTVSSSPDPVYNWSIPDTCSSCPHNNNDSVMIFTADITESGNYVCKAKNEYGSVFKIFNIIVLSKPIMHMQPETIVKDEETANNILLTCSVTYAYPTPNITWSIINPLSNTYALAQGNSSNYKLHCNGTIEIYHNFLSQRGFMALTCTATNMYGSVEKKFYLWEHGIFANRENFMLYVGNLDICEDLIQDNASLFKELVISLRTWFSLVCNCDGYNNLHSPQLTCLNSDTGSITTIVHHDGQLSAKTLIDLAKTNISNQDPPIVHLPHHGWILFLIFPLSDLDSSSKMDGISKLAILSVTAAALCSMAMLILCCLCTVLICHLHKRQTKIHKSNTSENAGHLYDEIGVSSTTFSTATSCKTKNSNSAVIYEASSSQSPAYQSLTKLSSNNHIKTVNIKCTIHNSRENIYSEY
ncbi:immunoglobulin superfamily member 10-like isoform X3 [Dysidea avara]|uniref:immunoglobulin superfamily member 10-like isoform X3 n=1 Tax=Dysidea avara TaxID=196820 RepID=UPI00331EF892